MIGFNLKSLKALPRFFQYRNDIDIFTEDKVADKEFYKNLFERLLDGKVKVNDVTPLGSKTNVVATYKGDDKTDKRKKYYIVDGDLDLIYSNNLVDENNLISLDRYCIENYLIDETGVIELIYLHIATDKKEDIKQRIAFNSWLSEHTKCLVNLFFHFAILKKYSEGPEIKSCHSFLLSQNKATVLDAKKITAYAELVKIQIIKKLGEIGDKDPKKSYQAEIDFLSAKWGYTQDALLKIVSGKNYLLPLLQFRINSTINIKNGLFRKESLKLFLATHSDIKSLDFLKKRILN